jgi:hypothetical protein
MGRGIGGHQSHKAVTTTWLTPPEIIRALGPFDLDPCAAPSPRPWPTARHHVELPQDGLASPWHGRVWLNPPYGRDVAPWLSALRKHGHGTALVFARTEVEWFFSDVWSGADAVLFLEGRLHFHHADGTRAENNSGGPSCVIAYGAHDAVVLGLAADVLGGYLVELK